LAAIFKVPSAILIALGPYGSGLLWYQKSLKNPFVIPKIPVIFALLLKHRIMSVTRLKRKNRKDKAKSARRRQSLKIQNFQPVIQNVDIEKIKEEFKAKAKKA
jgi:hypothetical protein